jgi:uncharacterized protein YkwD
MNASSATGRGAARTPRRPAKVVRIPAPRRTQRRRAVHIGAIVVALGLVSAIAASTNRVHRTVSSNADNGTAPSARELRILKLMNDMRARTGLAPLRFSPGLMKACRTHSLDMAARGYLGHDSPNGDTPADRVIAAGVNYLELGENLYTQTLLEPDSLPERTVAQWLDGPRPRANLLSPAFRGSAVAVAQAANGDFYVTANFIR